MPRKARVVEHGLLRKGFRIKNSRHRHFTYVKLDGQVADHVSTVMSHGSSRDIGDNLLAQMARQLHLTRREFDELIDCGLSQDDYEAMMRRDGIIH